MNIPIISSDKAHTLTKALLRMTAFWKLSGKELSEIIGISESSATRLHQGKKVIEPDSKEGELAVLLLRIYRSLNALVGNHHDKARDWLQSNNTYFNNKPIDTIKTVQGLVLVLNYLDAMRGKL
ncbi:MAG: MbcA/ParS/Xre antitoxin family protein [Gammaproteobacteria bacterium]|nr:MbcA/ParS/Xre antitoxin family protein [Gammaproteobacteria bacterium]